jgi:hypothetical protein
MFLGSSHEDKQFLLDECQAFPKLNILLISTCMQFPVFGSLILEFYCKKIQYFLE